MRAAYLRLLAVPLAVIAIGRTAGLAAPADAPELSGTYKVVFVAQISEVDLALIDIARDDGKATAKLKATLPGIPGKATVSKFERKGDHVTVVLNMLGEDQPFKGTVAGDGKVTGSLRLQGNLFAAWMEKTDAKTVAPFPQGDPALQQKYMLAMREGNPKAKAVKLQEIIKSSKNNPSVTLAYGLLVGAAGDAGLSEKQVKEYADEWVAAAKPYGPEYTADVQVKILKGIGAKKPYAKLALELAKAADQNLGEDASTETRAEVANQLAAAAKLAGDAKLASTAEAKALKLDGQLDEEYHKKVPPFKPETSVARKGKQMDRVVLLELFRGCQCGPCVAADVAFDGLIQSYKPTELVTLQYHLHIPAPDPLTNDDSVARSQYYAKTFGGTPATYFNGKPEAGGGGGMDGSKGKYDAYRAIIDNALEGKKQASIDLKVTTAGDDIRIVAMAQATSKDKCDPKKDEGKDGEKSQGSKLRLRLVLVEEQIRYVGGNKLRFHHHVVRNMPGGAEGKPLEDGQGKVDVNVKLGEIKKGLESYLAKMKGAFPSVPPIELKDLAVVAFVQDDDSMNVLHAVMVPVEEKK